jgi:hypothetical protein
VRSEGTGKGMSELKPKPERSATMTRTNLEYAAEKFSVAVSSLAAGTGDLQDRLYSASITILPLQTEDMPDEETRNLYEHLMQELTKYPAEGDEGLLKATLRRLGPDELQDLAQIFVTLYSRLYILAFAEK